MLAAGAVRPSGDRAGDGLAIDVSLVGEGPSVSQQWLAEVSDTGAGPDRRRAGFEIDTLDAGQE